jgi:hypothetical protein
VVVLDDGYRLFGTVVDCTLGPRSERFGSHFLVFVENEHLAHGADVEYLVTVVYTESIALAPPQVDVNPHLLYPRPRGPHHFDELASLLL